MNLREHFLQKWYTLHPRETPVIFTQVSSQPLVIKDESKNETRTYKAKHGWMMGLDYLTHHYPLPFIYYLGSTGNAAMADFFYTDLSNDLLGQDLVSVVCFYPLSYDTKTLGPDSFGRFTDGKRVRESLEQYRSGRVIQVDFSKAYWFGKICLEKMCELGIQATAHNSLDITEGFKPTYSEIMEEFIAQIRAQYSFVPHTLFIIQFGAGMLYDDSKVVLQAQNISCDLVAVSTGNRETLADKICDSSQS